MPKYLIRLGGDSAVKREIVNRNDRRFFVPVQSKSALALRTDDREICMGIFQKEFNRDQFRFILRFPADCKCDILCCTVWVRAIERRKSKTIFCDGVFQFLPAPSAINVYDRSLSQFLGSAARPR